MPMKQYTLQLFWSEVMSQFLCIFSNKVLVVFIFCEQLRSIVCRVLRSLTVSVRPGFRACRTYTLARSLMREGVSFSKKLRGVR